MSETSLSPMARKNRREALGLLLGTPFLASAAFPQQKTQKTKAVPKTRPMVMILEAGGTVSQVLRKQHLSIIEQDFLVLVNLDSTGAWMLFDSSPPLPKSPFQGTDCVTLAPYSYQILKVDPNAPKGDYKYCSGSGGKCDLKCPKVGLAGGDITIDP